MDISLSRTAAVAALKTAIAYTDRIPEQWSFLLLDAKADGVTITANCGEGQCTVPVAADVKEPGLVLVKADLLSGLAQRVSAERISLKTGKNDVTMKAGSNRYRIPTLPDLASLPIVQPPVRDGIELPAARFLELLAFASHAMANQDVRYYLNGVCLTWKGKHLSAVGTDGHRMAFGELELEKAVDLKTSRIIVPSGTVKSLLSTLSRVGNLKVRVEPGKLHVEDDSGMHFHGVTVDGQYPDAERVIPTEFVDVVVSTSDLKAAVERANLISATLSKRWVSMRVDGDQLNLECEGGDRGMTESIGIERKAKNIPTCGWSVNPTYLHEAIAAIEDDKTLLRLQDDSGKALRIDAAETAGRTCVIMPVRA